MKKENLINDREKAINLIADENLKTTYEFNNVEVKVIEEMGEFLQVLVKLDHDSENYIEELADVIIVLRELIHTLPDKVVERLDSMIEFKLERTLKRMHMWEE